MPLRIVSPVSSSVSTRNDGSSCDHLADGDAELLGVGLVLGGDGDGDDRIREHHRLERGRVVLVAERVAGLDVLQADDGDDVAGLGGVDFVAVVGVHFHHAADALGLAGEGVENGVALLDACPSRCG